MRIIISPAKKMHFDTDSLPYRDLPVFLDQTRELLGVLNSMSRGDLKKLWKCNDQIVDLNFDRLQNIKLERNLTPAILAYEGIQYQYMAPGVFTDEEFRYIQEHLRILSGFYGLLKPFDGATPYRLEMQAKLKTGECKDLYQYWSSKIAEALFSETNCIINLASKEYAQCVSRYLTTDVRFITCVFGEEKAGKVIEKGTMCKMARGEMVRYMAENQITNAEDIKTFAGLGYRYASTHSAKDLFVFLRDTTGGNHD